MMVGMILLAQSPIGSTNGLRAGIPRHFQVVIMRMESLAHAVGCRIQVSDGHIIALKIDFSYETSHICSKKQTAAVSDTDAVSQTGGTVPTAGRLKAPY